MLGDSTVDRNLPDPNARAGIKANSRRHTASSVTRRFIRTDRPGPLTSHWDVPKRILVVLEKSTVEKAHAVVVLAWEVDLID
jgi:hypothetical protein